MKTEISVSLFLLHGRCLACLMLKSDCSNKISPAKLVSVVSEVVGCSKSTKTKLERDVFWKL